MSARPFPPSLQKRCTRSNRHCACRHPWAVETVDRCSYEMSIGNGEWRLSRQGEPFNQRFSATMGEDGNMIEGRWEYDQGDGWKTDFDLVDARVLSAVWIMRRGDGTLGLLRCLPRGRGDGNTAPRHPAPRRARRIHPSRSRSSRTGTATAATRTPLARAQFLSRLSIGGRHDGFGRNWLDSVSEPIEQRIPQHLHLAHGVFRSPATTTP